MNPVSHPTLRGPGIVLLLQLSLHLMFIFASLFSSLSLSLSQIIRVSKCPEIVPGNCWSQGVILENRQLQSNQNKPITYWPIYDLSLLLSRHQLKDADLKKKNVSTAETAGTVTQARRLIFGPHKIYFLSLNTMYIDIDWIFCTGSG